MNLKIVLKVALTLMVSSTLASAQVITFDDLPESTGTQIGNGYQGLDWNNFYYLSGPLDPDSGYQNGTVSSPNVGYNGFGDPASFTSATPFTLTSADITAAWNNGLNVEVIGYNGATELYDNNYTVNTTGPTDIAFDYSGITEVEFITSGGTPAGLSGSGEHMAIDNIVLNGVPDAGATSVLLGGAVTILGLLRRKLS